MVSMVSSEKRLSRSRPARKLCKPLIILCFQCFAWDSERINTVRIPLVQSHRNSPKQFLLILPVSLLPLWVLWVKEGEAQADWCVCLCLMFKIPRRQAHCDQCPLRAGMEGVSKERWWMSGRMNEWAKQQTSVHHSLEEAPNLDGPAGLPFPGNKCPCAWTRHQSQLFFF